MITKIEYIKNCGKFVDFQNGRDTDWDGMFKKVNTIYACNGLGKTTIAQIFTSLRGNYSRLKHKKNVCSTEDISVSLKIDNKNLYYDKFWRDNNTGKYIPISTIDVFDHYFTDNFLNININNYLYESVFLDTEHLWTHYKELESNRDTIKKQIDNKKRQLNSLFYIENETQTITFNKSTFNNELKELNRKIEVIDIELKKEYEKVNSEINKSLLCIQYIDAINKYLNQFGTDFKICQLFISNSKNKTISFSATINEHILDENTINHAPSEGDKTALSLAFFLAYLDILPENEVEKRIIVFDDPFASFDDNRKEATLTSLQRLTKKCNQLFLLSHDLSFIKKFSDKLKNNLLNLKIFNDKKNKTSSLKIQNISEDSISGIVKDFMNLKQYSDGTNDVDPKCVGMSIRSLIEGFLRIKYYDVVNSLQGIVMAGHIIRGIEEQHRLDNAIIQELRALVDYSNGFHHPDIDGERINETELSQYVTRTLAVLNKF